MRFPLILPCLTVMVNQQGWQLWLEEGVATRPRDGDPNSPQQDRQLDRQLD